METIYFARVRPQAVIPAKRAEDAGYDVYACLEGAYLLISPHQTALVPTGIASACSPDYYFQLLERGSTGRLGIGQRSGVIDSGYRGEWLLPITNHNALPLCLVRPHSPPPFGPQWEGIVYDTSKAIAQAVLLPVPQTQTRVLSYDQLESIPSGRRQSAWGSTNL